MFTKVLLNDEDADALDNIDKHLMYYQMVIMCSLIRDFTYGLTSQKSYAYSIYKYITI